MLQKYYVDANIWLNLWKKEGDPTKGVPYWQIAETFIEKVMFSDDKEILYSGFLLKELKYKLDKITFAEKLKFLRNEEKFLFVNATQEDYDLGRKMEGEFKFKIGFFDCLHIAMSKRLNAVLVTRDAEMLKHAKKYVVADKPENLIG